CKLIDPCTYCGQPASGWDHVPPLHYIERLTEEQRFPPQAALPACAECNGLFGGVLLTTLDARRKLLRERLRRKYRRVVNMPECSDDEIADLSPEDAQRYTLSHDRTARFIRARIGWHS